MPRPGGKKTSNSIFSGIKERKKMSEDEKAKRIADEIASNTRYMITRLDKIDPYHSKLSDEDKERVDKAIVAFINHLNKSPNFTSDVREIDKKLIEIIEYFELAVNENKISTINYSISALATGLDEIRRNVSNVYAGKEIEYIDLMTKYLSDWISVLNFSKESDKINSNVIAIENLIKVDSEKYNKKRQEYTDSIRGDAYINALNIRDDSIEGRKKWTDADKKLYEQTLELAVHTHVESLRGCTLEYLKNSKSIIDGQLEDLKLAIINKPDLSQPDLMFKYRETVNRILDNLADVDQKINEGLEMNIEIEAKVDALNEAPGNKRLHDTTSNYIDDVIKDMQRKQNEIGALSEKERSERARLADGILSKEEMEIKEKQYQEEKLKRLLEEQEMMAAEQEAFAVNEVQNELQEIEENQLYITD